MNIKQTITSHAEKAMAYAALRNGNIFIDPAPPVLASPLIWAASAIWLYFVKKENDKNTRDVCKQ